MAVNSAPKQCFGSLRIFPQAKPPTSASLAATNTLAVLGPAVDARRHIASLSSTFSAAGYASGIISRQGVRHASMLTLRDGAGVTASGAANGDGAQFTELQSAALRRRRRRG